MGRYLLAVMAVLGLAILAAGMANAECGKDCAEKGVQAAGACQHQAEAGSGCHNPKCEHKSGMEAAADTEVKVRGMVKSVDADRGEILFTPEGKSEEVPIVVEGSYAARLKAGDRLLITYEDRRVNVATKVLKQFTITELPKPCVNKR